ncbi:UNVERIFIED_CONTAM: DUF6366 family protein [Halobacillus marinus]
MSEAKETPEERRERMRAKDIKRNSSSASGGGVLPDLVGTLGSKWTALLLVLLIVGHVIYQVFNE